MVQQVVYTQGQMQDFVSKIEFSLNFEDRKNSVKVRAGEHVQYDGTVAKYVKKPSGEEVSGKTTSLRSAVASNWLTLFVEGNETTTTATPIVEKKVQDTVVEKPADYSILKGGSFDKYVEDPNNNIVIVGKKKVITEEDQIVKKTTFSGEKTPSSGTSSKVSHEMNSVKEVSSVVSSSTSIPSKKEFSKQVIQSDDGHASHIIERKSETVKESPKKAKNSFTVDSSTPSVQEGASLAEVKRATIRYDESQDARVVRKVGEKKMAPEPNEVEGIVLRKTGLANKQASGSTPVADLSEARTQADVTAIEKEIEKKNAPAPVEKKNYIDMLPDDWGTLHWVKKEKFIMAIDDIEFLKFIMKVESVKAVHAACRKRMVELAKFLK